MVIISVSIVLGYPSLAFAAFVLCSAGTGCCGRRRAAPTLVTSGGQGADETQVPSATIREFIGILRDYRILNGVVIVLLAAAYPVSLAF
ncbi:hypothetical protein AB0K15_30175 [Amycolatopsis sp. NPDC049253]|uniref:hypothetical protein n=1 Tax=Amycolatopsis sp. NPDC049253 TaxID=3155274 RepID=UPI00342BDF81